MPITMVATAAHAAHEALDRSAEGATQEAVDSQGNMMLSLDAIINAQGAWRDVAAMSDVPATPRCTKSSEGDELVDAAASNSEQGEQEEEPKECLCGYIKNEKLARRAIMEFFEDPNSSTGALWSAILVLTCIVISTLTIIFETLPPLKDGKDLNDDAKRDFFVVESICIAVFTIEYVTRVVAVENRLKFFFEPMNLVDFVAIAPYYIDLLLPLLTGQTADDLQVLRLFRLARIFRIFKLSKYSSGIKICARAIVDSKDTLGLMIFMLTILVIVFSSFEFFCEKGDWDSEKKKYYIDDWQGISRESKFISIPAAMWWTIVTVMTVGYGDMVPQTIAGKIVAALAMICSIVIMALPISVIGANFSRAWMENKEQEEDALCENSQEVHGRQVVRSFEPFLDSLQEQNTLIEDILDDSCEALASLHMNLRKARAEYAKLNEGTNSDAAGVLDLDAPGHENMKQLVTQVIDAEADLQNRLQQVSETQGSRFEEEMAKTLVQFKELEDYTTKFQNISAEMHALEQAVFGHPVRSLVKE